MSRRTPQKLDEVEPMGAATAVQRPLGEAGVVRFDDVEGSVLGGAPPVAAHSAGPAAPEVAEPDEGAEPDPAGVAVRSLAELELLVEQAFPSNQAPSETSPNGLDDLDAEPDDPLFDPGGDPYKAQRGDGIMLDPDRAPVIDEATCYRHVVTDCADRLLSMSRDRWQRPLRERIDSEPRMFAQIDALACIGSTSVAQLLDWHGEIGSPAAAWVVVFALGCIDGREPLEAIAQLVTTLGSFEHGAQAADAFAASPNPHAVPLGRALLESDSELGQATAIEILSLRGLMAASDLEAWIGRGGSFTKQAAIRGLSRLPEVKRTPAVVEAELRSDDPALCWEAARACTRWGSHSAYSELRRSSALSDKLAERAVEIFVMTGEPDDLPRIERLVTRYDMTPALLDGVARFGHATCWAFLSHYLSDVFLQDDAAAALETLFGACLPAEARLDPFAWDKAIASLRLDAELRYRRGQPWSPATVASEWQDGVLPASAIASRLDELSARAEVALPVALHGWHDGPEQDLTALGGQARKAARGYRPGSWTWR
ncbi:MAG: hypothetical protein DRI90_05735 [Deltaproteobacteria bacterium]|nr:MAG: hypothetical protein DRI90_05735 [Deltaproteobacteria bacterium]